jgi:hypothetical protein
MQTECSTKSSELGRVEGRPIVAGSTIGSTAIDHDRVGEQAIDASVTQPVTSGEQISTGLRALQMSWFLQRSSEAQITSGGRCIQNDVRLW